MRSIKQGQLLTHIKHHWFPKHKPVGGVKVMYQHCMLLAELDYKAYPLLMEKYHGNFFGYDIESKHIDDTAYHFNDEDVLIFPEYLPYLGQQFTGGKKLSLYKTRPTLI